MSKQYVPETWNKWQYDLFLSSDTLARDTTVLANIKDAKLYSNPLADIACFSFYIDNKAMFRAVIIDKDKKKYWTMAKTCQPGYQMVSIDISGPVIPAGYYRIYYSLSAIGYSHYYRPLGDIQKLWTSLLPCYFFPFRCLSL